MEQLEEKGGIEGIEQYYKTLEKHFSYPMTTPSSIAGNIVFLYHKENTHDNLEHLIKNNRNISKYIAKMIAYYYLKDNNIKSEFP